MENPASATAGWTMATRYEDAVAERPSPVDRFAAPGDPLSGGTRADRRIGLAAVLGAWVLCFAAGCGGSSEPEAQDARAVFDEAGCGNCHSLAAANATGTSGPDLDASMPSKARIERQIRQGGGGMPSFADRLTAQEIDLVAGFVAASATPPAASHAAGFSPDARTVRSCERTHERSCYEQAFGNLAFRRGPAEALTAFEQAIRTSPEIESNCHPIAHTIGAAALLRFDGDVGRAFAAGTAACGSGYYHGLLEWKLAGVPEQKVGSVAHDVCATPEIRATPFVYYQCVHGLGHGLMLYTKYDLPKALNLCHGLTSAFEQVSCSGGVFMENQQSSYGIVSRWLKDDDLLYPCSIVGEADKLYCYLLVTSRILQVVGYDWQKTAAWCRRSEPAFVQYCFQSYGRDASGHTRQDPRRILELCRAAGDGERECIFGAVRDILNNDSTDRRAGQLCRDAGPHRPYCFLGLGSIVGAVHPGAAEQRAACAKLAGPGGTTDCVRGAQSVAIPG